MPEQLPPMIKKERAEEIAHDFIRDKFGNIPNPSEPRLEGNLWVVPIDINYPRVFMDKFEKRPIKTRFIKLNNVGEIQIYAINGEVKLAPRFYDLTRALDDAMSNIRDNVEKALVKVGARNFSTLPFPEHRHTPIIDILSLLLVQERFRLEEFLTSDEETIRKYRGYMELLNKVGLIRITEGNYIIPGNLFSEMERIDDEKGITLNLDQKLGTLLSMFFEHGFGFIDSIRQVLGSHLTVGGFMYRESFEFGGIIPFTFETINESLQEPWRKIKASRYLIDLQRIGIIEQGREHGENVWYCKEDVFKKFNNEKELLEPISKMISNSS